MEFKGASLYREQEIRTAIENFNKQKAIWKGLRIRLWEWAQMNFTPSFMDKMFFIKTLEDKYKKAGTWDSKVEWAFKNGYLSLDDEQIALYDTFEKDGWYYENELEDIVKLFGCGRECYLNPEQASVVTKFLKENK